MAFSLYSEGSDPRYEPFCVSLWSGVMHHCGKVFCPLGRLTGGKTRHKGGGSAEKSYEAPTQGLAQSRGLRHVPSPPLPGALGTQSASRFSPSRNSSRWRRAEAVGALQREASPEGTETLPQPRPRGPLPWGWPISSCLLFCRVVNGVRHIPSGPNVRTEDVQIPLHNVGVTVPLG